MRTRFTSLGQHVLNPRAISEEGSGLNTPVHALFCRDYSNVDTSSEILGNPSVFTKDGRLSTIYSAQYHVYSYTAGPHHTGPLDHRSSYHGQTVRLRRCVPACNERGCTADTDLTNRRVTVFRPRKSHHEHPHVSFVIFRWLDSDSRQWFLYQK